MTRTVPGWGKHNQPLLALVGEAPGREEEREGKPFVGPSGHLLDQMLGVAGIHRMDCWITNVVKQRPPNNNFGIYYSDKSKKVPTAELMAAQQVLRKEIHDVNPAVVIAFGETALQALAGPGLKVGNERGKMIEVHPPSGRARRVMSTWHPAYILRVYSERCVAELDIKKALRQARDPYIPEMNFNVDPSLDEILAFCADPPSPMSFDIETIGPSARSLGFAWSPTDAISVQLIRRAAHRWPEHEERIILQSLNTLLLSPEIDFYLQNFPFDTTMIAREFGFHVPNITLDTMYAHHLLYPELPKSLDFLSSIHTDFHRYWGPDKFATDESNARYNCYDCCATWISAQAQIAELEERGLMGFYRDRVHPTVSALTRMQNRGIRIDVDAREIVRTDTNAELERTLEFLHAAVGREISPNSPKQIKELLYDEWKLPAQRKPGSKSITTDDDALRSLARKFPQRAATLNAILLCRKTRKLVSTYVDAKLRNGRALTSYGITVSGRITSGKTWDGYGGNLQNIPRGSFRRLYVPDPDKTLIKADLKQAEYMVFCWSAPVHEFIYEYTHNPDFDVHRRNASVIYGVAEECVSSTQRYSAKQGVYAGNYKIGALKASRMYDMEFAEAKHLLENYRKARPELTQWWQEIEDAIKTTRTLRNPLGRERIFLGRVDDELFRKAYNHFCQSTVADIINAAVVSLDSYDDGLVDVLLQVHDELVCQCPSDRIVEGVARVRAAMEIPVKFPKVDVPMVIPAEIAVGPNWFDVTEVA